MPRTSHQDQPPNMHPMRVGARIAALRALNGLTQTECWKACGVHASAWGQYESGGRAVPPAAAVRIALKFDVTLDFLYLGDFRRVPHDLATRLTALGIE
jgi:transcriptional regulator with XRE-family HTH domain